jgi:hypothetical protein
LVSYPSYLRKDEIPLEPDRMWEQERHCGERCVKYLFYSKRVGGFGKALEAFS